VVASVTAKVATPLELVVTSDDEIDEWPPFAARWTSMPGTGAPVASRSVTVTVALELPSAGTLAGALLGARRVSATPRQAVGAAAGFGVVALIASAMPTYWAFAAILVPLH